MRKRLSLATAIATLFVALSAMPAAASSELQSCLQSATVCFSSGASIGDSEAVRESLEGVASVAVVADDGSNSLNPNQLATQLAQGSGVDELILVVDMARDRFGVYSESGKGNELIGALNGTGEADGGAAIVAAELSSIYDAQVSENLENEGTFATVLKAMATMAAVVLVPVIVVVVTGIRRSRVAGKGKKDSNLPSALRRERSVEISEELRRELDKLIGTVERYGRSSRAEFQEAAGSLEGTVGHIFELFRRIDRKNSKQNREIAQVRYLDIVRKLNSALSVDYFEDIVRNPQLWDSGKEKVDSVLEALRSVDRQVIENIKQVNSSREIAFRVAVDSLIQVEGATVKDAYDRK